MKKERKKHILEQDGLVTDLYTTLWHSGGVFGKSKLIHNFVIADFPKSPML